MRDKISTIIMILIVLGIIGVVDDEVLKLAIPGDKSGVIDVHAKVSDDGYYEVHLDTDDANAFLINPGDIGTISK